MILQEAALPVSAPTTRQVGRRSKFPMRHVLLIRYNGAKANGSRQASKRRAENDSGIRLLDMPTGLELMRADKNWITHGLARICHIHGMRFLYAIGLALFSAHTAVADDTAAIEWSATRLLSWDDFVGPVPMLARDERVAATTASLEWSYGYTLQWSRDDCTFTITHIDSKAEFHPESSWVRPDHRTAAVLQHEQGHFDIAQLFRNNLDAATSRFVGVARSCRGSSQKRAARYADEEIARLVGSVYEDIWLRYRREQDDYDSRTRHGMEASTQADWTARLDTLLRSEHAR